jgi:CRISPR/Cas system-associated protein Cas10 (large subunit of type III CRISPR-Cas system)
MRHQKSVQMFNFAAEMNREFASKVADSPKVTCSAAVLAFMKLDPATQLDMIREARERHLRDTQPAA